MSKKQSSGGSPVSLFPFLAVLMCTMGALILLLIVTSRRIRERALHASVPAVAPELVAPSPPESEPEPPRPIPPPALVEVSDPRDSMPLLPQLAPDAGELLSEYRRREAALLREWSHKAAELRRELAPLKSALAEESQKAVALQARLERSASDEKALMSRRELIDQEKARISAAERNLLAQQDKNNSQLPQLESRLQELSAARAVAASQYEIVAYDGRSGTSFDPIVIECTANEIRFTQQGVGITPAQIIGFSPAFNPLRSATAALAAWQIDHQPPGATPKRPYVLFLVRPGGTEAYYVAQGMLGDLPLSYGVELIPEDLDFKWPEPSAEQAKMLKSTIERALQERQRVASGLARRGTSPGEPVVVDAADGTFHLAEIDELRQPTEQRRSFGAPSTVRGMAPDGPAPPLRKAMAPDLRQAPEGVEGTGPELATTRRPPAMGQGTTGESLMRQQGESPPLRSGHPPPPDGANKGASNHRRTGSRKVESLENRRWGQANPAARIGYERSLKLEVFGDHIDAGDKLTLNLPTNATREQVEEALAALVDRAASSWGDPPVNFYWIPRITLEVHPGGNVHTARLKGLAESWGLRVTLDQKLE